MAVIKKEKHPTASALVVPGVSDEPSTRDTILRRSLELINDTGMVDFRIDALSRSLDEYDHLVRPLTTLLDLRQYYLLNRVRIRLDYKYRGVVLFRSSDLGAMTRDREVNRANEEHHLSLGRRAVQLLTGNGYIRKEATRQQLEDIHACHYVLTRWCLNYGYQAYGADDVANRLDYLALMSLHALYPVLSEKGLAEFAEIMDKVSADDSLGDPPLQ